MKPVEPILVSRLFPELLAELLTLLRGLRGPDWYQPTAARAWCAKDVVAHLLDGDIRRLPVQRGHCPLPEPELPIQGCGRSSPSPRSGEGGGER